MGKRFNRTLAFSLALAQFLAVNSAIFSMKKNDYKGYKKPKSTIGTLTKEPLNKYDGEVILTDKSNKKNLIYKRKDSKTGELNPISIFDSENSKNHQYGANQEVFRHNFKQLIEDPYIWDELQKYYPEKDFEDHDEAMYFYKLYLDIIYDCGCGYAAAANYVFHLYEGREKEFYETFGFPMYTVYKGVVDFNYELFMLKFFNFSNLEQQKLRKTVEKMTRKPMLSYKVDKYRALKRNAGVSKKEIVKWTEKDWDEYRAKRKIIEGKLDYYNQKYQDTDDYYFNFGIELNGAFGYLYVFLGKYGIRLNCYHKNGFGNLAVDDIVAADKFLLYGINAGGSISFIKPVNGLHYFYITEITKDGLIIVSSWGDMYAYQDNGSTDKEKIVLKAVDKK